jgi:hypothetical protein
MFLPAYSYLRERRRNLDCYLIQVIVGKIGSMFSACPKERFELEIGQHLPLFRFRELFQEGIERRLKLIANGILRFVSDQCLWSEANRVTPAYKSIAGFQVQSRKAHPEETSILTVLIKQG